MLSRAEPTPRKQASALPEQPLLPLVREAALIRVLLREFVLEAALQTVKSMFADVHRSA